MSEQRPELTEQSPVERIKADSDYLRGTIRAGLADPITGGVSADDTQLLKFHGVYQQDDRDLRSERRRQKLEPAYQFMIRARVPGGVCTPAQWRTLSDLAREHADGTLRLTTRQAFQFHGVIKDRLKATIAGINQSLLDTLAACGDVNRNVMCNPNPVDTAVHADVFAVTKMLSERLSPQTTAYHELWLDGEKLADSRADNEPLYGRQYLPRKFKTAVAVPPINDVDVYAHDLGFIAVIEHGALKGFDVSVGGGMGMSHGERETYPRLGDVIGFCRVDDVPEVAEAIVAIQRDYGDRVNRKRARFKYTIDDYGLDWLRDELDQRLGWQLQSPVGGYRFLHNGDRYGWLQGHDGRWHLTLFIENGRIGGVQLDGLDAIAESHAGDFRLTPNQNLVIAGVPEEAVGDIDALAREHGLAGFERTTPLRRNAMACVALPTCGMAMAEGERYLPSLIERIEKLLDANGIPDAPIHLRMTGCPNGCARPYLAEIGLVGKAVGRYALFLGGDHRGERLNRQVLENADESGILETLEPLIARYARERADSEEAFGDFLVRVGVIHPVERGPEVHG